MRNLLSYLLFAIVVILLQLLLFDNAMLGMYIHPLAYIAVILLLPMHTHPVLVLLAGLLTGVTMDIFTGDAGLNTIATLPIAFARPFLLPMLVGRDLMKEGELPSSASIGNGRFARYSIVLILAHSAIYFIFESLSMKYFHVTLLRILLGTLVTFALVWLLQMLLSRFYINVK